jgi:5'-nucleotidase
MHNQDPARPLIFLTNDDGVGSPGLAAAAAALDPLGDLLIVAPAVQQTSMGRSRNRQGAKSARFTNQQIFHENQEWSAWAIDATPAVTVQLGFFSLADRKPDLLVSGINYGENVGTCVTVSGTIGAALEAAELGIRSLAVSLEINTHDYHSYDQDLDFRAAVYFTRMLADRMLAADLPSDVDVLKLEIPADATSDTEIRVTRQDKIPYYSPLVKMNRIGDQPAQLEHLPQKGGYFAEGTDAHALAEGLVSITPLSLDLTSRVEIKQLEALLFHEGGDGHGRC